MINNLPDDMLNIIFYLINLKCHTCNLNINNLDKLLESKIIYFVVKFVTIIFKKYYIFLYGYKRI